MYRTSHLDVSGHVSNYQGAISLVHGGEHILQVVTYRVQLALAHQFKELSGELEQLYHEREF